jgi:hypothetical protein
MQQFITLFLASRWRQQQCAMLPGTLRTATRPSGGWILMNLETMFHQMSLCLIAVGTALSGSSKMDFTIRCAHVMHTARRHLSQMIHPEIFGGRHSSRVYFFWSFSLDVNGKCPQLCGILPGFDRMHYTFATLEANLVEKIYIERSVIYSNTSGRKFFFGALNPV